MENKPEPNGFGKCSESRFETPKLRDYQQAAIDNIKDGAHVRLKNNAFKNTCTPLSFEDILPFEL